jgi:hypothetical protein
MQQLVFGSAFLSGFTIMLVQMMGGRLIAPWFGGDVYVWGSIITIFMLALSLGYLVGGRWSLQGASLRRYGALFVLAGLSLLPLVFLAEAIMAGVFDRFTDPRYGSLVASVALFFVPSVVMGMVSPYSIRLLTRSKETSGASAGVLYFVSTLGSALGTLATSFYLVAWFDINTILWAGLAALACNGLLLMALNRRFPIA